MKIDRAKLTDIDAIHSLLQSQLDDHGVELSAKKLKQAIAEVLQNDRWGMFLVAWEAGEAIGVAAISYAWTLEHGGRSAWLDELYVIPERRGRGVGTALLQRALEDVQSRGCLAIDLEVETDHRRAERLYERMGFERLERHRWVRRFRQI